MSDVSLYAFYKEIFTPAYFITIHNFVFGFPYNSIS